MTLWHTCFGARIVSVSDFAAQAGEKGASQSAPTARKRVDATRDIVIFALSAGFLFGIMIFSRFRLPAAGLSLT
jgi:hypothetical protein